MTRSELVDAASTAKIERELARLALEKTDWNDRNGKMLAWHKYLIKRTAEAAAEDALFEHDMRAHGWG